MKSQAEVLSLHVMPRSLNVRPGAIQFTVADLERVEGEFRKEVKTAGIDERCTQGHAFFFEFEAALAWCLTHAYPRRQTAAYPVVPPNNQPHLSAQELEAAHLFVQRVLYQINRLKFFWYDDLSFYCNERSLFLQACRNKIEDVWQAWEREQVSSVLDSVRQSDIKKVILEWTETDKKSDADSVDEKYIAEQMNLAGYLNVLKIFSVDALVEASHLSRMMAGTSNEVQAIVVRLFLEEYGAGRLSRKHSTYFARMLEELGLNTTPEYYLQDATWESLASINEGFYLSEGKRHFLRYMGGLLYTEIATPVGFSPLKRASDRLGVNKSENYWALHIQEDIRHGAWMVEDVALPLLNLYPNQGSEILWGYAQRKLVGARASRALAKAARSESF